MQEKIKLLPLLLLYILYILLASKDLASENALTFNVAEPRYAMFANNLSHGYYSPRDDIEPEYPEVRLFQVSVLNREDIYLWSGPGYPIVLLPFVLLRMPWLLARLLNAFFLFGAVLYFYCTLRFYMSERPSLYLSFLLGVYPPFFARLHLLLTETLTVFLICGFMFHFCKLSQNKKGSWTHLLMAGFFLGYLALTKILFGYVIITSLTVSLLLYAWKRTDRFKRAVWVCCFALLTCLPYLFYTYSLTGKVFYWANSGGMSLYWMSTPYEGEFGDWFKRDEVERNPSLAANHKSFFDYVSRLPSIQRDEAFTQQAIRNIFNNPKKFVVNWVANCGRLLFNYPYSYTPQKLSTYAYIIPDMFVVVIMVLSIYPTWIGRRLIPHEVFFLIGFATIAFGGSSLLSAYQRFFMPLVPIFCLWISLTLTRVLRIEMHQQAIP
jgi:4-amino-4-deoxy-L-arabinose transferase-like glycosyltransferase